MKHFRIAGILLVILALASSLALAQSSKQVDINSATEQEMVSAGIDKAAAKKIIEARPFRNKTELVSRQLITREQYEKIKDSLIAKQSSTPSPMKPAGK
jgi:DNA uptake protein ComE-like DNA-binding protein